MLVVDDEPTVRMLIGEVLRTNAIISWKRVTAPPALKILESGGPVDLLITDVGLPGGMNGRQIADAARRCAPA